MKSISPQPTVLDYSNFTDVDPYIEIVGYPYERFIQDGSNLQAPIVRVRLPLIGPVQSGYSMNYTSSDMSFAYDAAVEPIKNLANMAGFDFKERNNTVDMLGGSALQTAFNAASFGGEFRNQLANETGLATNGRQESSFVSIGMRDHSFDWILVPRNADETAVILQIIKLMKLNMHPTVTGIGNSFLKFPTEFTIGFYSRKNNGERLNIPVIPDCSLASFNITYNQNGAARFHDDNTALSYRLSMSFVEGNQLTREDIERGDY
jgi:hypothetical protein